MLFLAAFPIAFVCCIAVAHGLRTASSIAAESHQLSSHATGVDIGRDSSAKKEKTLSQRASALIVCQGNNGLCFDENGDLVECFLREKASTSVSVVRVVEEKFNQLVVVSRIDFGVDISLATSGVLSDTSTSKDMFFNPANLTVDGRPQICLRGKNITVDIHDMMGPFGISPFPRGVIGGPDSFDIFPLRGAALVEGRNVNGIIEISSFSNTETTTDDGLMTQTNIFGGTLANSGTTSISRCTMS
ncbi:unnamed protein product [Agarophyton chilense]|eukprot:gb/GEZJ01005262.1/.p1 GENE.gb/GEZJ01005262.1/~~gb/GEZJ01005262.1/.p1  ORF type:complete len:245 (-),score=31.77 gb/GEZJ01005262.1/:289-1023(-)